MSRLFHTGLFVYMITVYTNSPKHPWILSLDWTNSKFFPQRYCQGLKSQEYKMACKVRVPMVCELRPLKVWGKCRPFSRLWKSVKKWIIQLKSLKVCEFWLLLSNQKASNNSLVICNFLILTGWFYASADVNYNHEMAKLWHIICERMSVCMSHIKCGEVKVKRWVM